MISANSPKSPLGHAKCPCRVSHAKPTTIVSSPSLKVSRWDRRKRDPPRIIKRFSPSRPSCPQVCFSLAWPKNWLCNAMPCSIYREIMMKTCAFHYSKETEHLFKRRAFFSSWLSLPFRSTCQKAAIQTLCPWTLPCFGRWASSKTHCQTIPIVCLGQFCCSSGDVYLAMKIYPWYRRTKSGKPMENIMLFRFLFITCCYFTISTDPQFSPEAIETKLRKASATACPLRCHGRS